MSSMMTISISSWKRLMQSKEEGCSNILCRFLDMKEKNADPKA